MIVGLWHIVKYHYSLHRRLSMGLMWRQCRRALRLDRLLRRRSSALAGLGKTSAGLVGQVLVWQPVGGGHPDDHRRFEACAGAHITCYEAMHYNSAMESGVGPGTSCHCDNITIASCLYVIYCPYER
jgi:hypothetical protein